MGFNKMLFGKENSDIMKFTYILVCLSLIFLFTADMGTEFNPPDKDTPTHYYGTPRPDPSRVIDYYDHVEQRFRYMDEKKQITITPSHEPQAVYRKSRKHRLFDELTEEVKDELRDEIEMEMDYWE